MPTFRADVRRFTVDGVSWFGGGADLTPYYLFDEDAEAFHASWRRVCNAHDPTRDGADEDDVSGALHERCKRWCDDYFYIPARKEHRGVGGIFFDDMSDDTSPSDASPSDAEAFTRAVRARVDAVLRTHRRTTTRRAVRRGERKMAPPTKGTIRGV